MNRRVRFIFASLVAVEVIVGGIFAELSTLPDCSRFVGKACTTCWHQHQHNEYLYLPLVYGMTGLLIITLAIYTAAWLNGRTKSSDKQARSRQRLYLALAALWGLLGVSNVAVNHLLRTRVLVAVAAVLLIAANVYLAVKTLPQRAKPKQRRKKK